MKKQFIILLLISLGKINAQDSLSTVFARLYNEYRVQKNLPTLIYDMQIDSLATIRLIESSKGVDDCFAEPMKGINCKDGIRDLHFKFKSTSADFNSKNDIFILNENMIAFTEFTSPILIKRNMGNGFFAPTVDTIKVQHENNQFTQKVAEKALQEWIESHGHNINLLNANGTRFAFKVYRTMHNGFQWLHAVFLMGTDTKK